jgi:hypothetical protein
MRTLASAVRQPMPTLTPLPWNFPQLEAAGIRPRRGTITMIAATPAAGKTFIATKLVQRIAEPTLFFSADTDEATMLVRAAAMVTGDRQSDVGSALLEDGADHYAAHLASAFKDARFVFETDPTYEDLELETAAMTEVYGACPGVIVIDNLMNLVGENENEWASMRDSAKAIKRLVRITGASVFVLHHMSENNSRPNYPSPRRDIQGKVSQLPELIISLAASENGDCLRACAVKNRFGIGDPTGNAFVEIPCDLDTGSFYANRGMKEAGIRL